MFGRGGSDGNAGGEGNVGRVGSASGWGILLARISTKLEEAFSELDGIKDFLRE